MNKNTKFLPGQSGNPSGRKPGNAKVSRLRELIAADIPAIIAKLTELALAGDVSAAKVLIERTIPALRPQAATFTLDTIPSDSTATIGRLIIDSALRADIPADAANMLLSGLASQVRIEEYTELTERIAALEAGGSHG
ncbi:DUF5681 domain-containing protein [Methylobacter sp. G7]|uniref:DUF5681 domain-containing protein n=1 Tax=Methylobacter sp. G7 TaxID=3230117 RepID=UPI003D8090F0